MDRETRAELICNLDGRDPNNPDDWNAALAEADQQIADGFEYLSEEEDTAYYPIPSDKVNDPTWQ